MEQPAVSDRINKLVFVLAASLAGIMVLLTIGFPATNASTQTVFECQEFHCKGSSCERTSVYQSPIDETNKIPAKDGTVRTVVCDPPAIKY